MTDTALVTDTGWTDWPADTEVLLRALRTAALRCDIDKNEIVTVGLALKAGMVTPRDAIEWLYDIGLVGQVIEERAP